MARTKVIVPNAGTDKGDIPTRIGSLDSKTQEVLTSDKNSLPLGIYEDMGDVIFHETRINGEVVQERGRYKMKKVK